MTASNSARRKSTKREASAKSRSYKPSDLTLVLRLLEVGNDEYDIAHVLGISLESLLASTFQDDDLREALESRDDIRLWDGSRNIKIAQQLAGRGYSEIELGQALRASPSTILRWRLNYPDFDAALKMTEEVKIKALERILFEDATGYVHEETKYRDTKSGRKKERECKMVPGSQAAKLFYLSAKKPNDYGTVPRQGQLLSDDPLDEIGEIMSRGLGTVKPVERNHG